MTEPITISSPLETILKEIISSQKETNTKLETLMLGQVRLEEQQKRLEEKLDGLSKRIESQEFISRGVLLTLLATMLGGAAKMFGLI
jgi:predicted nuclease with TOPRIM domain